MYDPSNLLCKVRVEPIIIKEVLVAQINTWPLVLGEVTASMGTKVIIASYNTFANRETRVIMASTITIKYSQIHKTLNNMKILSSPVSPPEKYLQSSQCKQDWVFEVKLQISFGWFRFNKITMNMFGLVKP